MLKKGKLETFLMIYNECLKGNQIEEVLRVLILQYVVKQTKLSVPTSKLEGF